MWEELYHSTLWSACTELALGLAGVCGWFGLGQHPATVLVCGAAGAAHAAGLHAQFRRSRERESEADLVGAALAGWTMAPSVASAEELAAARGDSRKSFTLCLRYGAAAGVEPLPTALALWPEAVCSFFQASPALAAQRCQGEPAQAPRWPD